MASMKKDWVTASIPSAKPVSKNPADKLVQTHKECENND